MTTKPTVFVEGYWETNLGDDLFLYLLCKEFPTVKFEIETNHQNSQPFKQIPNLSIRNHSHGPWERWTNFLSRITRCVIPCSTYAKQVRVASHYPIYLELGGSLFILPANGKLDVAFRKRQRVVEKNIQYLIMGSNFGPYYSKKQLRAYTDFFSRLTDISFRDEVSYLLFNQLANVNYFPDLVLNLPPQTSNQSETVVISVIDASRFGKQVQDQYLAFIEDQARREITNGNRVTLMAFCKNDGDLIAAERIKKRLVDQESMVDIFVHQEINESLAIIQQAKKIIATRYHSMILGWVYQKPTFVISYSKKTTAVINTYFPAQSFRSIEDLERPDISIRYQKIESARIKKLHREAHHHFDGLTRVLKRYE